MKVWLLDSDTFIKVNQTQIKEVTDPVMFKDGNVPSEGGLFSTEIFGTTAQQRRHKYGYIDLKGPYLTPKAYISLIRLNRKFQAVVYGTAKFTISNGVLQEDDKGGTGLQWLYDNWEKIKFTKNDSNQRKERVNLLTDNAKDVIFLNKFPVLPAFFRDVNTQSSSSNPKVAEINSIYSNIIRNVRTITSGTTMDYVIESMRGKTQDLLVDIYNTLKEKIEGKSGYIRQFLLGKSVDYSSRVVITAGEYVAESVHDQEVDYFHTGVPLAQVCSEFTPFMIFWLKNWFKNNFENQANSFPLRLKNGERAVVKLDNPGAYYNETFIDDMLTEFVENPYTRFNKLEIPVAKADMDRLGLKEYPYFVLTGYQLSKNDTTTMPAALEAKAPNVSRPMTWTDLLYIAALDVVSDKHIWVTRYPVTDYLGSYVTRIAVMSTRETVPMLIAGHLYKHYPKIDFSVPISDMDVLFKDTFNICPLYLAAIGGDHDGDQITGKCAFAQETNEECERIMMSKASLLSIRGTGIRNFGNEGTQTLYTMTRFH